ncbi:hypothetical protein [Xanthomonas sp. 1678]|uniref:hypothetical protein n=1 Tax=Xanthomonas sp. 1678 TaxID=3158788 RepID=UPI00285EF173|nr:hypothetical protein [Xanthomonas translucens]
MHLSSSLLLLCALCALPVARAHAGASLWVDDASITAAGHCQVESWWRAAGAGELTAAPACAWASTEVGLTLSHGLGAAASAFAIGVKQSLRDPEQGRWGAALSLESSWQARSPRYAESTLNLPLSFALDPRRRTLLHVNLGWSQPRGGVGSAHAGLGLERAAGGNWTWLGECYRERAATLTEAGARYAFNGAASVDLLAGRRSADPAQNWLTLGLNVALPD